jgi:YidC/Oxa1 family membrane protein insertase
LNVINSFLGLDISDNPWHVVTSSFASHHFGFVVIALLIPILAYVSQVISIHMMPTADSGSDQMAQQMKTMNTMMPLVSLFFTFVSPIGLGLYWIMGAVIRTIQMFFLNRHFEKINLDDIIEKNKEKAAKKKEKRGQMQIAQAAMQNTRQTRSMADKATVAADYAETLNRAAEARANAKSGSLSSKANLVKEFNERNNK